jgi:hypothetical protein
MRKDDLREMLINIEVCLGKIDVHMQDLKADIKELKEKELENSKRIQELENFKAKAIGATSIIVPVIAFIAAIGHDIIKRFMGWS